MKKKKRTKTLPAALYTTKKTEEEVASKTQHRHHKKRLKKSSQAELNIIITKKTVGFFHRYTALHKPDAIDNDAYLKQVKVDMPACTCTGGYEAVAIYFLVWGDHWAHVGLKWKECQLSVSPQLTCILSYDLHAIDLHIIL